MTTTTATTATATENGGCTNDQVEEDILKEESTSTTNIHKEETTATKNNNNNNNDDELVEFDDEDEFVDQFLTSEWKDSVEIGLTVSWPSLTQTLHLSTQLPETAIAPLFDGTQWAGTRVWKAALLAFQYLEQQQQQQNSITGTSLLELGCGLGVPGMLWHILCKERYGDNKLDNDNHRVILTDQPSLVSQLNENIESNFPNNDHQITAQALSWSRQGILDLLKELNSNNDNDDDNSNDLFQFDICINCDCIYEPLYGRDAWEALADVLQIMAEVSPSTLLVTAVERRNGDGLEDFLQRLQVSPHVEPVELVLRNDDDKHHIIEIYVTRGKKDIS